MGNVNHTRYQRGVVYQWRVLKDNQRQLPCHESVKVRVKVLEPGVQSRYCDRCGEWRYFILEPMPKMDHVLRLRWLTVDEVLAHEASIDDEIFAEVDWLT